MRAYWEMIADELARRGWSYGIKEAVEADGRRVCVVDAHRDDGHRYVVTAETMLTAFLELKAMTEAAEDGA